MLSRTVLFVTAMAAAAAVSVAGNTEMEDLLALHESFRVPRKNLRHLRRFKKVVDTVEEEVEVEDTADASDPTEVAVTAEEEVEEKDTTDASDSTEAVDPAEEEGEEKTKKDDDGKRGTKNAGVEKGAGEAGKATIPTSAPTAAPTVAPTKTCEDNPYFRDKFGFLCDVFSGAHCEDMINRFLESYTVKDISNIFLNCKKSCGKC